jgi:hypothetical protein
MKKNYMTRYCFVLMVFVLNGNLAKASEFNWSVGFPKFFGVEYSQNLGESGYLSQIRLGSTAGLLPLTGVVKTLLGGVNVSWSDEYNLWVEPRLSSFAWSFFVDWLPNNSDWGIRADLVVQRFKGGGLAHIQNKESRAVVPVYDLQSSLVFLYPSLGVFKSWGNLESRWRLGLALGYRVKSYLSFQSSGPLAQLASLDSNYSEAFQEGLDLAESELANDINKAAKISPWIPSLEFSKSF